MNQTTPMKTKETTNDLKISKEDIVSKFFEKNGYMPPTGLIRSMTIGLSNGNRYIIEKRVKQRTNTARLKNIANVKLCLEDYKKSDGNKEFWKETVDHYLKEIEPDYKTILKDVCKDADAALKLMAGTTFNLMNK